MLLSAGVDVGSRTTKAVILWDGEIKSTNRIPTGLESAKMRMTVLDGALARLRSKREDLSYVVTTGYGRYIAPSANKSISEIYCYAKGVNWLFPSLRKILDMGGQYCQGIRANEKRKHSDFIMNDKWAAGTGIAKAGPSRTSSA
ncbi:MAG: BadF/BadG/BcrA/BcrD ATPase family protein [Nitrospirota bacterium]